MRRREFVAAFGATMMVPGSVAQTARRKRLGYLSGGKPGPGRESTIDVLKASLRDLGWREGETLDIDARWADGDVSRLPRLANELVQLRPDVVAATGTNETKALQAATQDIPIVFHMVADPVAAGLVENIARPGGHTTGFAQGPQFLWGKRLGLLTEMLGRRPRNLAWLGNRANSGSKLSWVDAQDAAAQAAVHLARVDIDRAEDLQEVSKAVRGLDGLFVQWDFLMSVLAEQIARLAVQERVAAVYENRAQAAAGGLMSYGGDLRENFRQGAVYVDRILRGVRPADLPVIQASRFELVLNKSAAKAIGLTIPDTLLARADEVIE